MVTLEQLRVFVAVAERQHVTRAAEALHIVQSAVSATIAAIEGRYGVKLFNRVGRGIELTETGTAFLEEARAVLARAEAAELVLSEMGGLARGTLRVQASQTIASYWLPRHLVALRRAHPAVDIRLGVGNTAQVVGAVLQGTVDVGFTEGEVDEPTLVCRTVARDQLVLVVDNAHPWADGRAVSPQDLAQSDWVLREPGSGTRSVFENALRNLGASAASLRVALELPTNEAVRAAVEAGIGATAISASVAAPGIEAGLITQVCFPLPDRAFQMVWHAERQRSRASRRLEDLILPAAKA
ncbi:MAG TPA: LysR substrate-binding domain-containing protein [Acetobacteraceae bacterium]|nr:LysR substrate-binding domain-containing protein [Acetobacteraceae bacterium]